MILAYKVLYRLYRLGSWGWRLAQRRFTPAGLTVVGGLLVAMVMGVDTEDNVDYQAFALLLGLLVTGAAFGVAFRARFSAERLLPRFGTAGVPLSYTVRLRNLTARSQRGLVLIENLADARPSFQEWLMAQLDEEKQSRSFRVSQRRRLDPFRVGTSKVAVVPAAPPHLEVDVAIEVTPMRRGVLRFTRLTLARPDPLGLFQALANLPLPQAMLILPKRYRLPPIALPGTVRHQQGGVALASSVGQSEDFVALRDYRHGDPLRHIHWRSWAKAGKPVVKEFQDEFFVRHALVLDTFADTMQADVFEAAVSIAASLACTIQTQESLLDLLFVGPQSFCFTAGRGLARADQMLEILAGVRPCRDRPFCVLEHLVLDHLSTVSGCICVLVAWDEPRQTFVKKLRALGLPVLVLVVVPPAPTRPLDRGPMQDEPERFHVVEVGRVEEALAELK